MKKIIRYFLLIADKIKMQMALLTLSDLDVIVMLHCTLVYLWLNWLETHYDRYCLSFWKLFIHIFQKTELGCGARAFASSQSSTRCAERQPIRSARRCVTSGWSARCLRMVCSRSAVCWTWFRSGILLFTAATPLPKALILFIALCAGFRYFIIAS